MIPSLAGAASRGAVSAQAQGPSAATSTVSRNVAEIHNDGVAYATVTVTVLDRDSGLIVGHTPVVMATGINNTLSAPSASNASGLSTCTLRSTTAEAKTVEAFVAGRSCGTVTATLSAGVSDAATLAYADIFLTPR